MKRIAKYISAAFCIVLACFACSACGEVVSPAEKICRVVIADGDGYECADPVRDIVRGSDVSFELTMAPGVSFDGVDYPNASVGEPVVSSDGSYKLLLTLHDIEYSEYIEPYVTEGGFHVAVIADGERFECEENIVYSENGSAEFSLFFEEGFTFGTADHTEGYEYAEYKENGRNRVYLKLDDVGDFAYVTVNARAEETAAEVPSGCTAVEYSANGGSFGKYDTFTSVFPYSFSRRANTVTDRLPEWEGHVLIGWNTSADGGRHIGIGSRVDTPYGDILPLYADWIPAAPESAFDYSVVPLAELTENSGGSDRSAAVIEGCDFSGEVLGVPEELGGYPVAGIGENAFVSMRYLRSLALPDSLISVASGAVSYCGSLEEVYLYDNIEHFDGNVFVGSSPGKLHINAALPPAYTAEETALLANKIEMLARPSILPRMVVYGGCAVLYGTDACMLYEALGEKYDVINMGVIGGTCSTFQLDVIRSFMRRGDVLVHTPEAASEYQLFANLRFDSRVYSNLEANYDLLALLDLADYDNVWQAFSEYLTSKRLLLSSDDHIVYDYDHDPGLIDVRGDLVRYREGGFVNEDTPYKSVSNELMVSSGAGQRMTECYDSFAAEGIDVLFGWAPMDGKGTDMERLRALETYVREVVSGCADARIFMDASDAVMDEDMFYDTTYHLSSEGAKIYTSILVEELAEIPI